jgi:hypothetical protein
VSDTLFGVRGPDPRNTVVRFPDREAAGKALLPGDVVVVSTDAGRAWAVSCIAFKIYANVVATCGLVADHDSKHTDPELEVSWSQEESDG